MQEACFATEPRCSTSARKEGTKLPIVAPEVFRRECARGMKIGIGASPHDQPRRMLCFFSFSASPFHLARAFLGPARAADGRAGTRKVLPRACRTLWEKARPSRESGSYFRPAFFHQSSTHSPGGSAAHSCLGGRSSRRSEQWCAQAGQKGCLYSEALLRISSDASGIYSSQSGRPGDSMRSRAFLY